MAAMGLMSSKKTGGEIPEQQLNGSVRDLEAEISIRMCGEVQEANGQEQLVGKGGMWKTTCTRPCLVCFREDCQEYVLYGNPFCYH